MTHAEIQKTWNCRHTGIDYNNLVVGLGFPSLHRNGRVQSSSLWTGFSCIIGAIVSQVLPKNELTELVLAEIRKREGCAVVDDIVILENTNPRSATNWEISIIAASSGDPAHIQRMAFEVQRHLQPQYRLR